MASTPRRAAIMNPAILGELIGAVPGSLAAALATWASIRSVNMNLEQTKLTLANDYSRWISEKRADAYVEMLRFLRAAEQKRAEICRMPAVSDGIETMREATEAYLTSQAVDILAQADPYVSEEAHDSFMKAWYANLDFWKLTRKQIESGNLDGDKLQEEENRATQMDFEFRDMARHDLRTSGIDLSLPRPPDRRWIFTWKSS